KDFVPGRSGAISGTLYSTRDASGNGDGEIECGGSHTAAWYGMVIFVHGKPGPELSIHAKNGSTVDVSNITPIATKPVMTAPQGDGSYARLDGGNMPFTGNITGRNLNNILFVDGTNYANIAAAQAAAGSVKPAHIVIPSTDSEASCPAVQNNNV